jgi:hypothetical protein
LSGGTFYSFGALTNVYILHGKSNAPVTCLISDAYTGTNYGMEIAYCIFRGRGSTNGSTVMMFTGQEYPYFVHGNIYANVGMLVTDNCGYANGFINVNGSDNLIANNTLVSAMPTKQAGATIQVRHGSRNMIYNNLTVDCISAVDLADPVNLGITQCSDIDYNCWAGIQLWQAGQSGSTWTNLFYNLTLGCPYRMPEYESQHQPTGAECRLVSIQHQLSRRNKFDCAVRITRHQQRHRFRRHTTH